MALNLRCLRCKRQIAYIKRATGEGICQVCGYVTSAEEVQKQIKDYENKKE